MLPIKRQLKISKKTGEVISCKDTYIDFAKLPKDYKTLNTLCITLFNMEADTFIDYLNNLKKEQKLCSVEKT